MTEKPDDAAIEDAKNFRRVSEKLFTAGQPTEAQLASAAAAGVRTVINLALHDDPNYSLPDERKLVESLGMTYVHIPVIFKNPTNDDLRAFFDAMDAHASDMLLVHCAANYRATVFLGLYRRLRLGMSDDEAFAPLRTVWQPNEEWTRFIDQAISSSRGASGTVR